MGVSGAEGSRKGGDRSGAGPWAEVRLGAVVVALLVVHGLMLAYGAFVHSPAFDEIGHLAAGLSHWHTGDFQLYRVNPPLVRMVAALPVLLDPPGVDWQQIRIAEFGRSEFSIGEQILRSQSWQRTRWQFAWARWACIPFSLLAGWVCFLWAREIFGPGPAVVALVLWCFCPLVLGHAQLIAPDTGAAALGLAAHYCFWKWLQCPQWTAATLCGIMLGLAELSKFTWVILPLVWFILWIVWRTAHAVSGDVPSQVAQLFVIVAVAWWVINAGYGFSGTFQPLGQYTFVSRALGGRHVTQASPPVGNRFAGTLLGRLPVPVPEQYLLGIDQQKSGFENGAWSYLRGEWRFGGWWYYYLYGLLVKIPHGTWLLMDCALVMSVIAWLRLSRWLDEVVLLAPALAVIFLVSSQTGFNHHLRYILPALPFLLVWASKCAYAFQGAIPGIPRAVGGAFVAGALVATVTSSLAVYPHSLSYFNELAGGPLHGHEHLVDSNIDWGQDLWYLKGWCDRHPDARPIYLAYWNFYSASVADLHDPAPPSGPEFFGESVPENMTVGPIPGWHAVSVNRLRAYDNRYRYFLHFRPVAYAGYSIYIYHLELWEVNRVRRQLGLPGVGSEPMPLQKRPRGSEYGDGT
ncbi:MAG: glycosyl transferase [Pirellulaceae bacterium]|nr:MAG: glycosyl transferase [Pirellulaceae bacterium]